METLCPSPVISNSSRWLMHNTTNSTWTKEENEIFESALTIFDEESPDRWFKVAAMIPSKSVYDVINQYRQLAADVSDIEAGLVPIPRYLSSSFALEAISLCRKRPTPAQRKKGLPWTEAEHRRFLLGLEKHGKGDWKNISRNFVVSKTPTQVASHAQKYYMRQLNGGKDKRRPSIHDITIHLTGGSASQSKPSMPRLLEWNDSSNDSGLTVFDSDFGIAFPYTELL